MRLIYVTVLLILTNFVFAQETNFLFDFGPNDVTNGNVTVNPDSNGSYWNNIIEDKVGSDPVYLIDTENNQTEIYTTVTSDFSKNGILNGGLLDPDSSLLHEFAMPNATQDYFYTTTASVLKISGLDKKKGYIFKFFGTRNSTSDRLTEYKLIGVNTSIDTLQTSGTDLGGIGYHGNNSTTVVSDTVAPNEDNEILLYVSQILGGFGYVGTMKMSEIEVDAPLVVSTGVLIDFGPNDGTNGNITENPDKNGNTWNNLTNPQAAGDTLHLVDNANIETSTYIKMTKNMASNGILNGGLLEPDSSLLGEFAIASATQDYFYLPSGSIGSFVIGGLNQEKGYIFKFFATRNATENRITQYTVTGTETNTISLQTSGPNLGGVGYDGNNSTVAESEITVPDANGEITISVKELSGTYSYLGLLKFEETEIPYDPPEGAGLYFDFGPNDGTNGNVTENPDFNGTYWNSVVDGVIGNSIEVIDNFNNPTNINLEITSSFSKNGILHGGLLEPDTNLLGEFAIPTATQDYFYSSSSAAFKISGLNPDASYIFQFFGTRNTTEVRTTKYQCSGATTSEVTLQTSGTDLGGTGYNGNNSSIATTTPVVPNDDGEIIMTMSKAAGTYCYIGLMKIEPLPAGLKTSLENADFETGDLTEWTVTPSENVAAAAITTEPVLSGQYALKIQGDSVCVSQEIMKPTGTDYILSAYFYNASATPLNEGQQAQLVLTYLDGEGNQLAQTESEVIDHTFVQDSWEKVSVLATVPENTVLARASITWNGIRSGALFVDDVDLKVFDATVSSCTAWPQFTEEQQSVDYMQTDYVDSNWNTITLPENPEKAVSGNHTYWFRKNITVPQDLASDTSFTLKLCTIDGADALWFNGTFVSQSSFNAELKSYDIPASLVSEGENNITMQLGFLKASGFFSESGSVMEFQSTATPTNFVSVAGEWRFLQGIIFNNDNILNNEYKITIMGSSTAQGWGATNNYGYAAQYADLLIDRYEEEIGPAWEMSNISIGGNKTTDLLARFDSDLLPECAKYVSYGLTLGNEGIREYGQTAFDQFRDNMLLLIDQARDYDMVPIVSNCYSRNDYVNVDYDYVKQMDLLIHSWDVPSINLLGALDDGYGHYASGYYYDGWHANDKGHTEMFLTIPPSLFDALDQGKPVPEKVEGTSYTIENPQTSAPLEYEFDGLVHPFTFSFDMKTSSFGTIAGIETPMGFDVIEIDSATGYVSYTNAANQSLENTNSVRDNEWHRITITHYYATYTTIMYVDSTYIGIIREFITPDKLILGGSGTDEKSVIPESVTYRDWYFHRAGSTPEEIAAMCQGKLLKSSLELYAPLDADGITGEDPFVNLAQSLTTVTQNIIEDIDDRQGNGIPTKFELYNNYPNPFNPETTIKYAVAKNTNVKIQVFDLLGRKITTLVNEKKMPGYYKVQFQNSQLASGVYFYSIHAGKFQATKKMILLK